MTELNKLLLKKYEESLSNNYGIENYDEYTFGKFDKPTLKERIIYNINYILLNTIYRHRKMIYNGLDQKIWRRFEFTLLNLMIHLKNC